MRRMHLPSKGVRAQPLVVMRVFRNLIIHRPPDWQCQDFALGSYTQNWQNVVNSADGIKGADGNEAAGRHR